MLAADKLHPLGQFLQHGRAHASHDPHAGHDVRGVRHLGGETKILISLFHQAEQSWAELCVASDAPRVQLHKHFKYLDAIFSET